MPNEQYPMLYGLEFLFAGSDDTRNGAAKGRQDLFQARKNKSDQR
jgi:hypothetical protein